MLPQLSATLGSSFPRPPTQGKYGRSQAVFTVLVSHRKQFIFTKTRKTAGTSVESYFERFCVPDDRLTESNNRSALVNGAGVVGARGPGSERYAWHDHMAATAIKAKLGPEIWDRYFKFTIVRNPYEQLVSSFYFYTHLAQGFSWRQKWRLRLRKWFKWPDFPDNASRVFWIVGETEVGRFRQWLRGGEENDRPIFQIDGDVCVDFFIRFERLLEGVEEVCRRIEVPFEPERLPRLKSGIRNSAISTADFYDDELIALVAQRYEWELDYFGYQAPERP